MTCDHGSCRQAYFPLCGEFRESWDKVEVMGMKTHWGDCLIAKKPAPAAGTVWIKQIIPPFPTPRLHLCSQQADQPSDLAKILCVGTW